MAERKFTVVTLTEGTWGFNRWMRPVLEDQELRRTIWAQAEDRLELPKGKVWYVAVSEDAKDTRGIAMAWSAYWPVKHGIRCGSNYVREGFRGLGLWEETFIKRHEDTKLMNAVTHLFPYPEALHEGYGWQRIPGDCGTSSEPDTEGPHDWQGWVRFAG